MLTVFSGCEPPCSAPPKTTVHDIEALREAPAAPPPRRPKKRSVMVKKPVYDSNFYRRVSVQVTEKVPLKEVFAHLAAQTGVSVQLDLPTAKTVYFSAQNRPFIEVVEDLCALADLRFQVINNRAIRIELDAPYPVNYSVQFLNLARSIENKTSIATDVFATVRENAATADNGSNSVVQAKGESRFWGELEQNLKIILNDPQGQLFTFHKQGGLISVRGTSKQHRVVEEYLKVLRDSTATQVLIEAKVIEVVLKEEYKSGINWQQLMGGALRLNLPFGDIAQRSRMSHNLNAAQGDMLSFGVEGRYFSSILKAIHQFGATRTLSSPRITVLNNQNAILKVAQNQVYFRLNYDRQYNVGVNRENVSVSSDIMTVPIGLVMSVQPSIDAQTGKIILSLRPTISRLSHSVSDPAVDVALNANRQPGTPQPVYAPSLIPVVEVREIDSVLRLNDGDVAVLGGLMESRSTQQNDKLPVAGDVPFLGNLFKATGTAEEIVELVILLRAKIVEEEDGTPDLADQRLYEEYAEDPRAF